MIGTPIRKRVCLFNGDWKDFEVIELVYDEPNDIIDITDRGCSDKVKPTTLDVKPDVKPNVKPDVKPDDKPREKSKSPKKTPKSPAKTIDDPTRKLIPQLIPEETDTMCVKRRASLFFIISFFAFTVMLLLGVSLGTENWIRAGVNRDLRKLNVTDFRLPLKSFVGANPIDGSDPGAFLGLVKFGLFTGCKRFNYGLGVRDPTCFSGRIFSHKVVFSMH